MKEKLVHIGIKNAFRSINLVIYSKKKRVGG